MARRATTGRETAASARATPRQEVLEENGGGGVHIGLTTSGVAGGLPSNDNVIEGNGVYESGGPAIAVEGTSIALLIGNQLIDNIARDSSGFGQILSAGNARIVQFGLKFYF